MDSDKIDACIEQGRVRLTPFGERHLTPEYLSWLNDPQLMRFSEQRHRRHTLESCAQYLASFTGAPHFFWAIEAMDLGGLHVGNINAYVDTNNLLADMGLLVGHPAARHKGYGLDAWRAAMEYLFRRRGLRKISAGMLANNAGMIGVARKSGMVEDGRRVAHYLLDSVPTDIIYMAAFASNMQGAPVHG